MALDGFDVPLLPQDSPDSELDAAFKGMQRQDRVRSAVQNAGRAPAPISPPGGNLDDAFEQMQRKERAGAAVRNAAQSTTPPDTFARSLNAARRTGLPPGPAAEAIDNQQRATALAEQYPALGQFLADNPAAGPIVADDLQLLGEIGAAAPLFHIPVPRITKDKGFVQASQELLAARAARGKELDRYFASVAERLADKRADDPNRGILGSMARMGAYGTAEGTYGALEGAVDIFADPIRVLGWEDTGWLASSLVGTSDFLGSLREEYSEAGKREAAPLQHLPPHKRGIAMGVSSATQNMPLLLSALLSPSFALNSMGMVSGGSAIGKGKDAGMNLPERLVFGGAHGGTEVWTEKWALFGLLKDLKIGSPIMKTVITTMVREQFGEQGATHIQDFADWGGLHPEKTALDYLKERPDRATETFFATLVASGLQTGAIASVGKAAEIGSQEVARRVDANRTQEQLKALTALMERSKTQARDPQTTEALVESAAPGREVFINSRVMVDALRQLKIDVAEAAATVPAIGEQLQDALAFGEDIVIPLSEYLSRVPGTPLSEALLQHIRPAEDSISAAEAAVFAGMQDGELSQRVDDLFAQTQVDQASQADVAALEARILEQLRATGRFTEDVNAAQIQPLMNFYRTLAARLGRTVEEVEALYRLPLVRGVDPTQGGSDFLRAPAGRTPGEYGTVAPGATVDGRVVRGNVPNMSSIAASFVDYDILPGVREVPLSAFDPAYVGGIKRGELDDRTRQLADEIEASGEITPLIVAEDSEGLYIVEGGHRFDALIALGAKSLPAVVVRDTSPETGGSPSQEAAPSGATQETTVDGAPQETADNPDSLFQSVNTRLPTAKRGRADPHLTTGLEVDYSVLESDPDMLARMADQLRTYEFFQMTGGTPLENVESFIQHAKDNLLWLISQVPKKEQERAANWYKGANVIAQRFAERFNITLPQAAGVLAALSPQNPWDRNVSQAERVLSIMQEQQDTPWSPEMAATAERIYEPEIRALVEGKTLRELDSPAKKAIWLRAYDEAHNPRRYRLVTPEGGFAGVITNRQGDTPAAWGSLREIANAIRIAEDASQVNLSRSLGAGHKVRNFYNNIFDPSDPRSVTIDTHAVAAATLLPLGSKDSEVNDNFGAIPKSDPTGQHGTYVLYAEAYRRAAAELGLLPREVQSIAWEAARTLFPDKGVGRLKSKSAIKDEFRLIWKQYADGDTTLDETRENVLDARPGVTFHSNWSGRSAGLDAGSPDSSFTGKLLTSSWTPGAPGRGDGGVLAQLPTGVDQTATPEFGAWSHGHPVISLGESHDFTPGEGVVVQVVHGTTGDFTEFNRGFTNIESDLGGAFYFTNNTDDVGANYAGFGPDLTQKIQLLAERIADETERDYDDPEVVAEARARYAANDGLTMPVFVRFDNPVILGGNDTFLSYEETYDEELDEYGEPTGGLVDFVDAFRWVATDDRYDDVDVEGALAALWESGGDESGLTANQVIDLLAESEGLRYATDMEADGAGASREIIRKAFERAGYDGFIDQTVDIKFGSQIRVGQSMAGMDENTVHFIAFEPTQIKSALGNSGAFNSNDPNILAQNAQGLISFGQGVAQEPAQIALLQGANLSTFVHENAHWFFEVYRDVATQLYTRQQAGETLSAGEQTILDDMNALLRFIDPAHTLANWNASTFEQRRDGHEKVARAFEAYLFGGHAPSAEMLTIFQRFRAWMLAVYTDLKNLGVTLTDEVSGVFDRMLATDAAIENMQRLRSMAPLFPARPEGMTDAEWQAYQNLGAAATNDAKDTLQARSLREMRWLQGARGRVLRQLQRDAAEKRAAVAREVTAEVDNMPVMRAIRWLKRGETTGPNGEEIKVTEGFRLAISALREMYPIGGLVTLPEWEKLGYGAYGMLAKEGMHPDQVAEIFGFTSGDDLVRSLLEAPKRQELIDGLTDTRMLERYGDLADAGALERAADEAIHDTARTKFVAAELAALDAALGRPRMLERAAKMFAAEMVARREIRNLRPSLFINAASRAGKDSADAFKAGDITKAAGRKRDQLINTHSAREVQKAQAEVEKGVEYLGRFLHGNPRRSIDQEYVDQIDTLLERFDLKAGVSLKELDRRTSLAEWAAAQEAMGLTPVVPDHLLAEARRTHYKNMTVEEFRGLVDTVKNIAHLGRLKKKLLTLKDAREFAQVVTDLTGSIRANANRTIKERLESNLWIDGIRKGFKEFGAMHRKLASIAREMDGGKDGGQAWETLVRSLNEANDREAVLRETATRDLHDLLKPLQKAAAWHRKVYIPEINNSLSREGMLVVALNWGNEGNRQRLMDGDRWTQPQVEAILGKLTKTELDTVQAIWDYLDTYRAQVAEQQKRLTGVEPQWIAPAPFTVTSADGSTTQMRGGYYPAKYDTDRSTKSMAQEAANNIMDLWRGKQGYGKTRDGFTKERAKQVTGRPLRKDVGVLLQHLSEVTHRLALQDWLVDANRLLANKEVDAAIREHYGPEILKAMRDAVEDIARGEAPAANIFERGLNRLRTGATIAGLGWNLMTGMLQPLGLTQSMVRVGPKWVAKGIARWMGDAAHLESTAAWIYARSDFMRLRGKTMQREISEIRNQITKGGPRTAVEESYFYLIQKMQLIADIPTWLGAYEKAKAEGNQEGRAGALADQAVRDAQGGGQIGDLSAMQRGGPMLKLWTNFYSYFNVTYNLAVERTRATKFSDPVAVGRLAVDYLLLAVLPAALSTLLREAFKGDCEDEDCLVEKLIRDQATYALGMVVGLREIGSAFTGFQYGGPAGLRFIAELNKLGKQIEQGELDAAFLRAANNAAGVLFHYPAGQVQRTLEGLGYMAEEGSINPAPMAFGPPKE